MIPCALSSVWTSPLIPDLVEVELFSCEEEKNCVTFQRHVSLEINATVFIVWFLECTSYALLVDIPSELEFGFHPQVQGDLFHFMALLLNFIPIILGENFSQTLCSRGNRRRHKMRHWRQWHEVFSIF